MGVLQSRPPGLRYCTSEDRHELLKANFENEMNESDFGTAISEEDKTIEESHTKFQKLVENSCDFLSLKCSMQRFHEPHPFGNEEFQNSSVPFVEICLDAELQLCCITPSHWCADAQGLVANEDTCVRRSVLRLCDTLKEELLSSFIVVNGFTDGAEQANGTYLLKGEHEGCNYFEKVGAEMVIYRWNDFRWCIAPHVGTTGQNVWAEFDVCDAQPPDGRWKLRMSSGAKGCPVALKLYCVPKGTRLNMSSAMHDAFPQHSESMMMMPQWEFVSKEFPNEHWQQFPCNLQVEIECAHASYSKNPQEVSNILSLCIEKWEYELDFRTMTQINQTTKRQRRIRRMEVPNVTRLQFDAKSNAEKLEAIELELKQYQEDLKASQEEVQKFQISAKTELKQCQEDMEQSEKEHRKFRMTAKLELEICQEDLRQSNEEVQQLRMSNKKTQDALQLMQAKLQETQNAHDSLKNEMQVTKLELQQCEENLKQCQQELQSSQHLGNEAQEARQSLEAELQVALGAREQLQVEAQKAQTCIHQLWLSSEMWRHHCHSCLGPSLLPVFPDHVLLQAIQAVLQGTSHGGAGSRCAPMQTATVVHIRPIVNDLMWKQYMDSKIRMRRQHQRQNILVEPVSPATPVLLRNALPWMQLDDDVNERLAFHGTAIGNVDLIAHNGFDERVADYNGLYGTGIYAAEEGCKSYQYCEPDENGVRCLLFNRVMLGDPFYAREPLLKTHSDPRQRRRAPNRNPSNPEHGTFDSVIAEPGIPIDTDKIQQHREFVVFDRTQIYAEFAVYYTVEQ